MTYLHRVCAVAALALTAIGGTAKADALNFTPLGNGNIGSAVLDAGQATVNVTAGTVFVFDAGQAGYFPLYGGFCGLTRLGNCQTDVRLDFESAVTNLRFHVRGYDSGDSAVVSYFNGANLLGSILLQSDQDVDLSAAGSITSLVVDDSSSGAGYAFGEFTFNGSDPVVPEPSSVLLMSTGLGALVWQTLRKRSS